MLEALDVTVLAAQRKLLHRVSLSLQPGELVALAGAGGAGKSTLLRTLAGELSPKGGCVKLNARPLFLWRLRDRARLRTLLPQGGAAAVGFTVLEAVLSGRHPHCEGVSGPRDLRVARQALRFIELCGLENRHVLTLSDADKARVSLARAFAQLWETRAGEGRFLLLDEQPAARDPALLEAMLRAVRRFARERHVGVLAVLNEAAPALRHADRALLLARGALVAQGAPAEVYAAAPQAEDEALRRLARRTARAPRLEHAAHHAQALPA